MAKGLGYLAKAIICLGTVCVCVLCLSIIVIASIDWPLPVLCFPTNLTMPTGWLGIV